MLVATSRGPRALRLAALLSGALALALAACADGGSGLPQCEDGIDNDGDGLIDGADPACMAGNDRESEDPPPACSDGLDNDADGLIDHPDDPGCDSPADNDEYNPTGAQCSDGLDNDGDGLIDYPNDPGCLAPNQNSEVDDCPDGPNCPECGNGRDDDEDGKIDYAGGDTGCESASGAREFSFDAEACGPGTSVSVLPQTGAVSGTLAAGTSNTSTTCGGSATVGTGTEHAYVFTLERRMTLVATTDFTGTAVDTVLYVRRACTSEASQLACNDDLGATNNRSTLSVTLDPGSYFLVIDGKTPAAVGAYTLTARFYAGLGEECQAPSECAPGHVCRVAAGATAMTCELPVCSDGRDDDGDGLIDFPLDPGCDTPDDMTEDDTCPGTGCPACADGVDNDSDGLTDYPADTSCTSASGTSEADCPGETDPLGVITGAVTTGTTAGATNNFAPASGCSGGTNNAPDRVLMLHVRAPLATLTLDTVGSAFDTVLSLKDSLCAADLACDDDGGGGLRSRITRSNVTVGNYAVVVDGYSSGNGAFTLNVAGTYANGAACDPTMPMFRCGTGYACRGAAGAATCQPAACNDGLDNDGDGKTDYPNDPGCTSTADDDESDACYPTVGPGCPQCGNGLDDDDDGFTDYPADVGCVSASGIDEQCVTTDPVRVLTTATLTNQSTAGLANDVDLSCGLDGRDEVFRVRVDHPIDEIRVDTIGSPLDTVVAIKTGSCTSFDLQCDDNGAGNGDSLVFLVDPAPGDYFIVVDDRNVANPGTYNLRVTGRYLTGGRCNPAGIFTCATGYACQGAAGAEVCAPAACNDAIDQDGDGHVGYPDDPGCSSPSDPDESDDCPAGPGCPQCANGLDDDGDGFIDYPADPACLAASTTSELSPCTSTDPVLVFTSNVTGATTSGRVNDVDLSCGADGRDEIYRLYVTQPLVSLTVDTIGSDIVAAVALRTGTCNGLTDLACAVNNAGNQDSRVSVNNVAVGEYFIVVDDQATATPTTYSLNVSGVLPAASRCNPASTSFVCTAGYTCGGAAGSETCVPTACNDTIDQDGDGHVGYPADPGCTDISDDDESDDCFPTIGPACPVCSNGVDDDGDMLIDYPADPGCTAASGTTELDCMGETDPILLVTTPTSTGTTAGAANNFTPSCSSSNAPDRVHMLTLPVTVQTLTMDTIGSAFDTILHFRDSTCGTSIACDDDSGGGLRSRIIRTAVAPGTYAIIVDGYSTNNGAYTLNVTGTVAAGTACTSPLFAAGVLSCAAGTTCNGSVCQ